MSVQELVKLHGGSVRVESEFGEGSRFMTIPAGKSHLPAAELREGVTWYRQDYGRTATWKKRCAGFRRSRVRTRSWQRRRWKLQTVSEITPLEKGKPRELILLADDNADMRDYVRRLLSERYRVHAVANGNDAVDEHTS